MSLDVKDLVQGAPATLAARDGGEVGVAEGREFRGAVASF